MTLLQVKNLGNRILIFSVCLFAVLFLMFRSCEDVPIIAKTKEIKGTFKASKPNNVNITTKYIKEKGETVTLIDTLLIQNDSLINKFKSENDSLKLVILEQAIQLHEFTKTWEDSTLKATVSGISRGTVESIMLDYIIKPQPFKCPDNPRRILGGIESGTNLRNFVIKANAGFQTKKGNMFTLSLDNRENFYLGYSTTLIKF